MTSRLGMFPLLAWMLLLPAPAPAESLPQDVLHAEELIARGAFEDAVRLLQEILKEGDASRQAQVETYRLMGLAALYLGNEVRARQAYELLLALEPNYELKDDAPPKVRALVEQTRKARLGRKPVN